MANTLATAIKELGVMESPRGSNAGPRVEQYLKTVGLAKGNPWCAAFVAWCGVETLKDRWPVPKVGGCASLGTWGTHQHVLTPSPQVGDIFLLWFSGLQRFAHTGFVTERPDASGKWGTVEGNSNPAGGREGFGVFRHRRMWRPEDRFLHLL